ncbi:cytochrome c biogenesis CcdA family protein [Candidatus Margulisiibacteriota bacterium]
MNTGEVSIIIAFLAGVLTFFSPCVLPLIPSYLCYITGFSVYDLMNKKDKKVLKEAFISSVFFVLGFSIVFIALGTGVSFLGRYFLGVVDILRIAGGLIIIFFGLVIAGILNVPFLKAEKKLMVANKPFNYTGAMLVGMAFSVGWVPCVGPILSSILIVAGTGNSVLRGFLLLSAYSLGLGLPIIASAVAFNYLLTFFKKIKKYMNIISMVSGILLVILGLLLITDALTYLMALLYSVFDYKGI